MVATGGMEGKLIIWDLQTLSARATCEHEVCYRALFHLIKCQLESLEVDVHKIGLEALLGHALQSHNTKYHERVCHAPFS
jgi:hypothetical protein